MSTTAQRFSASTAFGAGSVLALATITFLSGCAVQARVYAPPPPRVVIEAPAVSAEVVVPGVTVTATEAPPPLPEYEQPPCPEEGFVWTPGYWHFGGGGYYWVPGTWVQPPSVGVLWTPGYWGFAGGVYGFHAGYWGAHVGFYGGVNYGFGYVGEGYAGGHWEGGRFAYNTSVTNVNTTIIHNTYNQTVVNNVTVNNRVSFNGGAGGTAAVPTARERAVAQERHIPPTPMQTQHVQEAARNPGLAARANGGHPAIAATARPAAFSGPGVVGARGAAPPARPFGPGPGGAAPAANRGPAGGEPANRAAAPLQPGAMSQPPRANGSAQAANVGGRTGNPQAQAARAPAQKQVQKPRQPPKQNAKPKQPPKQNAEEKRRE